MSRLGKVPVVMPANVKAVVQNAVFKVEGPKGKLSMKIPSGVEIAVEAGKLTFRRASDSAEHRAKHGLVRALASNMIKGVATGYSRQLEIVGVGYRAQVKGKAIGFTLGYSHPIDFPLPDGVTAKVDANTQVTVESADKELLGQICAQIRALRAPEPYQGKGILYKGEKIRRKAGKAAAGGK